MTEAKSRTVRARSDEAPASVQAFIVGESRIRLWGLDSGERIARQLQAVGGVPLADRWEAVAQAERALLLRADYLYEVRTLASLLRHRGVLMDGGTPAAAFVDGGDAELAKTLLEESSGPRSSDAASAPRPEHPPPLPAFDPGALSAFEGELRKSAPPLLKFMAPGGERALEDLLYGASYKGITDFVTKWWWPAPAKAVTRWCAKGGVAPNAVTLFGLALMLAVCWLFYQGWHFWGLALGWIMTLLDTVDGKLARVTVRSSKLGHWLDHGMDILHPPFWYWLWGLSLTDFPSWFGLPFELLLWCLLAGYIAGRLIEGAFEGLGQVSLFAWRPFDAWFRLIAARRNPCLVLLTAGWLLNSPALGFWLVAFWTAASSLVLLARLAFGCWMRLADGPLSSWLADPEIARRHPRSHQAFATTRKAYG